ncbi:ATP-binding cassette domain-containing protein [Silvanigrella paludirubra]|uniref:ATP-binding cassette domain-containing protein n=1 Tax=Silvanigrella paludirubra TaxID=2499159 RepID=A0A6N6VWZ6_9BACT|nr:ATP-binding cassette domain-containing protein [Silvanigrella paludirubra]KAB8040584.1 ATP-binding cassette domain-containing protein [Silvanigrella paludirubra]
MPGYQKKISASFFSFKNIFSEKSNSSEKILQKTVNKQKSLSWIFFLVFKKNIFIASFLQIVLLSLALMSPFIIKYYLEFFLVPSFAEVSKKLFLSSMYFFAFVSLFLFVSYLKKQLFINWKREIEYQSLNIMSHICCYSSKDQNNIMLNKFSDEDGNFFSYKFIDLPNVLSLLFSIPALVVSFIFIYVLMDKLFFIPISILMIMFFLQIQNQIFVSRTMKKVLFFLESRSLLLKKIFLYGNRVHLLAMESFFLRKINLLQQNSKNITLNIINRISASRVIFYYSCFILAIPSIAIYIYVHPNAPLTSIATLLVFFILAAHFYSNILSFSSRIIELKNNYKLLNSNVTLVKNNDVEITQEVNEEFNDFEDFVNINKKVVKQEKIWFHKASFMNGKVINLYNISFEQKQGNITAIVGQPNSGKSSFLAACAGELKLISGEKKLPNHFEILPQDISLFDGTLRENIILNKEFEGRRYIESVRASFLEEELNSLEDGDETYLDTKENTFSESFLRKIAIARILYAKSEFYFLDEPFQNLSQPEISHIFNEGFLKLLHGLNRVIVTEKLEIASLCDHIVVMRDGMIVEQGSHKVLIEKAGVYARLHYAAADSRQFGLTQNQSKTKIKSNLISSHEKNKYYDFSFYDKSNEIKYIRQIFSSTKFFFQSYFKNKNSYLSLGIILLSQIFMCIGFYSLFSHTIAEKFSKNIQIIMFVTSTLISLGLFYLFHIKNAMINLLFGSTIENKVYNVLIKKYKDDHSFTAKYLDNFSKAKDDLFASLTSLIVRFSYLVAGFVLISIANASALLLLVAFVIFTFVFALVKKGSYLRAYFEMQSEKNKLAKLTFHYTKSLKISNSFLFREYLYKKHNDKINEVDEKTREKDTFIIQFFKFISLSLVFIVALSVAYYVINIEKMFIGTVIMSFLSVIFFFQAFVNIEEDFKKFIKCIPYFEDLMRASIHYDDIENHSCSTSNYWPQKGSLRVMSLTVTSSIEYPNPIHNLDLFIPHGARFGFITDKGQNKTSTFFASLLLFVPFDTGTIIIDDEDILKLNPIELRDKYTYISMNSLFPFLTIRENLDPTEQFDDSEIWSVLNRVGIAQSVAVLRNGLNTKVDDLPKQMLWSGEILFFSFARAILFSNKILLVDNLILPEEMELRIIDLLSTEFKDVTVIFSIHLKSKLLSICDDVARFDKGILRRATIEKLNYTNINSHGDISELTK